MQKSGDPTLGLIGTSPAIEELRRLIAKLAGSNKPVLVSGPTGAGKELVVGAIHALGARPDAPMLAINCGAIPESLLEAQLFGHEKGAFTGADQRREGLLASAGEGTLFLDELAELPLALQAKLLRVLESGTFRAVGGTAEQEFHGRFVSATHANLAERVSTGAFREDLWYRLNVLELRVPPLDDRRQDIPLLVEHFCAAQSRRLHFSSGALNLLMERSWPGNVRQLRNLVDRIAVLAADDFVDERVVMDFLGQSLPCASRAPELEELARAVLRLDVPNKLEAMARVLVHEAMVQARWNKSAAARLLGVDRKMVQRLLDPTG
ncbi:MAG TPA: sigma-54 dependent transcriptional regulator [Myxococcaceae bacterium]|jgi:DNA-binding NtrC family response regulator